MQPLFEQCRNSRMLKLHCLGIAFADALAQRLGLEWCAVEDKYGRDPALRWAGTSIVTFPLTTISKRVERGETIEVRALFDHACATLEGLRSRGA